MTAGAADSKISNQPVTFESNRIGSIRFEFESNFEYSQVPTCCICQHCNKGLLLLLLLLLYFQLFLSLVVWFTYDRANILLELLSIRADACRFNTDSLEHNLNTFIDFTAANFILCFVCLVCTAFFMIVLRVRFYNEACIA